MRRIAILDGTPTKGHQGFADCVRGLADGLSGRGHNVETWPLAELDIGQCTGCFGCWIRTPGRCVLRDDAEQVLRSVINADVCVFASPLAMGFTSAVLKRCQDRLIPLLCPGFEIVQGEFHHEARYAHYPTMVLFTDCPNDADAEDHAMTREIHERLALDFKTELAFAATTARPLEEVLNAVDHL